MKISSVKTIRPKDFPNLIYLHIITDEGIIGLGETFLGAAGVEAHIHEVLAPYLLDKDPLKISLHHELCRGFLGTGGQGSIIGAFLGVVLMAMINNLLILTGVPVYYQGLVAGLVLIGAVGFDEYSKRRRGEIRS